VSGRDATVNVGRSSANHFGDSLKDKKRAEREYRGYPAQDTLEVTPEQRLAK